MDKTRYDRRKYFKLVKKILRKYNCERYYDKKLFIESLDMNEWCVDSLYIISDLPNALVSYSIPTITFSNILIDYTISILDDIEIYFKLLLKYTYKECMLVDISDVDLSCVTNAYIDCIERRIELAKKRGYSSIVLRDFIKIAVNDYLSETEANAISSKLYHNFIKLKLTELEKVESHV